MEPRRLTWLTAAFGLVVAGIGIAPHLADAQTPGKVSRIGVIYVSGHHQVVADGLREGLGKLGLEEGKHVVFEVRETPYDVKEYEAAARNLERRKVDLIYAVTAQLTVAVKRATAETPIVFYAGADPVALGLVASLAKPGGRLTGVYGRASDLTTKRLAILKEMIPKLRRVLTFSNDGDSVARENLRLAREAARQVGVQLVERNVRSMQEFHLSLQKLTPGEVDAYFHTPFAMTTSQAPRIIEAAREKKLPTMFAELSLVPKGGLAGYGVSYYEIGRQSAKHVQRILSGTAPKDLPVEQYDKIGFSLNLRTAREIGLTIPPSLLLRADQVIE